MAGSGRYILGLAQGLSSINHSHEIYLLCNKDNMGLLSFNKHKKVCCGKLTQIRPTRLFWEQSLLPLYLGRLKIDVLHSPVFVSPLFLSCFSVVTIFDTTLFSFPKQHTIIKRLYFTKFIPHTVKKAARIITISESSKKDIVNILKVKPERVIVTYMGVDHKVFYPTSGASQKIERKYGIASPFILYVGKIEPRKNLASLVKAYHRIRSHYRSWKLVIAGSKGWGFQEVFATVAKLGLESEVLFTGYVPEEDLPCLYSAAELFVYPSSYEGFGIPLLEAMACGTPVITSNISSLPEVVGDAGILVNPTDIDELAFAIQSVLNSESLQKDMKFKGLKRAKLFTWEETARRTLQVYEEVYRERKT